ncbi:MAG: flagellar biosynthetic protein FliO [Micrococcales bacterium]|nr:flagellar biosynthetic protein FliO [Micrococcales bacterium]
MEMDAVWLALRAALALACVLGLIWWGARRFGPGRKARPSNEPHVSVVERAALGRHVGVAVLAVGSRRLLIGFSEQQVTMLSELSPVVEPMPLPTVEDSSTVPTQRTGSQAGRWRSRAGSPERSVPREAAEVAATSSPLAGSLLHPHTWRDTVRVLQDKTVRR